MSRLILTSFLITPTPLHEEHFSFGTCPCPWQLGQTLVVENEPNIVLLTSFICP